MWPSLAIHRRPCPLLWHPLSAREVLSWFERPGGPLKRFDASRDLVMGPKGFVGPKGLAPLVGLVGPKGLVGPAEALHTDLDTIATCQQGESHPLLLLPQ